MKKILSLDGGGIRGLVSALILTEIEKKAGKPLYECFDLVAGTSTGAILALAIVMKDQKAMDIDNQYAAKELIKIYEKRGKDIFKNTFMDRVMSFWNLGDNKYSKVGIESVLKECFMDETIENALKPVLITSYDIEQRTPFFFKSWKPECSGIPMWLAARASSAAPTYFEPTKTYIQGTERTLVDGGLFANNPAVSAYVEAKRIFPEDEDFYILSIGTGTLTKPISYDVAKSWGKLEWIEPLIECIFDGVSDAVDYQMKLLLENNFHRLQLTLDNASKEMDDVSDENLKNLRQETEKYIKENSAMIQYIADKVKT